MILETSWEVCNKMGGIYTVLSSRARAMMQAHDGAVIFIGPLLSQGDEPLPRDFEPCVPEELLAWHEGARQTLALRTEIGRWRVPGAPAVVLVDFSPLWEQRGDLYFEMWQAYGLESDHGYGDYDEASLFGIAATQVMHSIYQTLPKRTKHIAIFNEWQTGMGLLYSKLHEPKLRTMFITHATTVGRSIAGNGKELYAQMPYYNGDQMAAELGVVAKHGVEKRAAHTADCFATVSKLTARECAQLIEREPTVLPNGFEGDFVPKGRAFDKARKTARERLARVASALTGRAITDKACFISLGGRYEYRNKGIDLFVEATAKLRSKYDGKRPIVAFLLVPAWCADPRGDLQYLLEHPEASGGQPLQHPSLTHWLHNMGQDAAQGHFCHLGLDRADDRVNMIFVPCYLHGRDGIFDLNYYDLLIGMDLTVYPSYYEPWGYTPLESIAFGVPTITTNLAGFGLWADEQLQGSEPYEQCGVPVRLVVRTDHNASTCVEEIADHMARLASGGLGTAKSLREGAMHLAAQADWSHFYKYYLAAYKAIK